MKQKAIGKYRSVVRIELDKRVREAFNDFTLDHIVNSLARRPYFQIPDVSGL